MPELPEVETTCRGIRKHIEKAQLTDLLIREARFRWPVDKSLASSLAGQRLESVSRRGKYILLGFETGVLMLHLGMSGSLRIVDSQVALQKHDHIDWCFSNGKIMRFRDPRRFGAVVWAGKEPYLHPLLSHLGPEPLGDDFSTEYLFAKTRKRKQAIKQCIMNADIVVGVGNIYANEALFQAGILPSRAAGSLSKKRLAVLVDAIKAVLSRAIAQGGTSLKDFEKPDGNPGYFVQELDVYGRESQDCKRCGKVLSAQRMNNRATVFCRKCQK